MGATIMRIRLRATRDAADHARAQELAARRMDEALEVTDAAWLEIHLGACAACRSIAGEYEAQRTAFRALRAEQVVAPRDLWARTSAAMDGSRRRSAPRSRLAGSVALAPVAGLLVIAIVVGAGLLNGVSPLPPGGGERSGQVADATPIAVQAGQLQVISRAPNGRVEIRTGQVDEVCPVGTDSCGLSTALDVTQSTSLSGSSSLDAIISPSRDHLVVVGRGDGPQSVYVLPVTSGASAPATGATATPGPRTSSPAAHATKAPDEPTATPVEPAVTSGPDATPKGGPKGTETPETSPSEAPTSPVPTDESTTASPVETPEPTASTPASETPTPAVTATPDGRPTPTDRPGSASPTPKGSDEPPTPTPTVDVTPGPDGAIEIARDVTIVGSVAAYSADGRQFAFSARPADGSTGPDVYLWQVGESMASAVTTDHGSVFAGWIGGNLLASRVVAGTPVTMLISPATGTATRVGSQPMWLPTVAPGADVAIWWDGSVRHGPDGRTWIPDTGRLILAPWPDDGGAVQVLAPAPLADWEVRWDSTGSVLAVWLLPGGSGSVGRLSLYPIDPDTGMPDVSRPRLADAPAYAGFSLRDGRLAWSAPGSGGGSTVQVLAWNGTTVGQMALPDSNGATVVR
jgi:hypothetical protein